MLAVIGSVQFFVFILLVGIAYTFLKRRKVGENGRSVQTRGVNAGAEGKPGLNYAVVTGGNGCLGKRMVKNLLADGRYKVHSLDLRIPREEDRNPVNPYIASKQAAERLVRAANAPHVCNETLWPLWWYQKCHIASTDAVVGQLLHR